VSSSPPDPSRLSLNQKTTNNWSVREAAEGCARAGIGFIGLWRDKVSETGLSESAHVVRDAGLRVSAEMVEVLEERPDLWAVLDVTHPQPPEPDSRLYDLPNVVLTPHIAGSLGRECRPMGRLVVDELRRYVAGEPLEYEINRERAALMA
jgi:hypothetical protein